MDQLGAGLLYKSDDADPFKIVHRASDFLSSSYIAEGVAIDTSLSEFCSYLQSTNNNVHGATLIICSDSQSNISSLTAGPIGQKTVTGGNIWKSLLYMIDSGKFLKIVF